MGGSRLMSVRCGEWRWPKSVVNGLAGMKVRRAGKIREMEARVLFLVANRLILYNLAETLGMPGDAPNGPPRDAPDGPRRSVRSQYQSRRGRRLAQWHQGDPERRFELSLSCGRADPVPEAGSAPLDFQDADPKVWWRRRELNGYGVLKIRKLLILRSAKTATPATIAQPTYVKPTWNPENARPLLAASSVAPFHHRMHTSPVQRLSGRKEAMLIP